MIFRILTQEDQILMSDIAALYFTPSFAGKIYCREAFPLIWYEPMEGNVLGLRWCLMIQCLPARQRGVLQNALKSLFCLRRVPLQLFVPAGADKDE